MAMLPKIGDSGDIRSMEIPKFVMMIIERLRDRGYQAYIVGGAVRDMCLHRPIGDWDVATSAAPEKIRSIFGGLRSFSIKHDTVTLVDDTHHYEVTTFRGSGKKQFSIVEDLGHRDFTINAMAYDAYGPGERSILDPHGGREDILRKLVRAVGNPKERFLEDPLRLLRAIRLAVELTFRIEQRTLQTISLMSQQLASVAQERIRDELMKILMSKKPSLGFNLMVRTGLLEQFLPELLEGYRKRQNRHHRYTIYKHVMESVDMVERHPTLRLTALFHDIAKPRVRQKHKGKWRFRGHEAASARLAGEIMERLRFSSEMRERVVTLIENHMIVYDPEWSDGAVRRLIRRVGFENINHLISFRRADLFAHGKGDEKLDLLAELEKRIEGLSEKPLALKIEDLAINGHKIMQILGLSPGPNVGKIANELMEKVTDHPELNTKEGLIALLKEKQAE
jgi:poly(A) polymerase/tRNA nucleotidyltransferase (CCA-adding enzyme)